MGFPAKNLIAEKFVVSDLYDVGCPWAKYRKDTQNMYIIPDELIIHTENKDAIFEAIEDFLSFDSYTEEEHELAKQKLRDALKDEPKVLSMLAPDLED